jgi:hypothetical protein
MLCNIVENKPKEILQTINDHGLEFYICKNIHLKDAKFIFPKQHLKDFTSNMYLLCQMYNVVRVYVGDKDVRVLQNYDGLCSEPNHVHWHVLYDSECLYDLINGEKK